MGKKLKEFEGGKPTATAYIYRPGSPLNCPDLEVDVEIGSDGKTKKIWVNNGCWSGTLYESKLEQGIVDVQVDWFPETVVRGCRIIYLPCGVSYHQKMFIAKHSPRMTFEASVKSTEKYLMERRQRAKSQLDDIPF